MSVSATLGVSAVGVSAMGVLAVSVITKCVSHPECVS